MSREVDSILHCPTCAETLYRIMLVRYPDRPEVAKMQVEPTRPGLPAKPDKSQCPACSTTLLRKGS